MSRRDIGLIAGVMAAVFAAAGILLVLIYGPAGAVQRVTGRGQATASAIPSPPGPGTSASAAAAISGPGCPAPSPEPAADFRLIIPRLGIDAHSEPLGIDKQGALETPKGKFCNVGWYQHGPAPGAPGISVMDGHLDWNGAPAVFWKLGTLKAGDEVVVHRDGAVLHFRVDSVQSVPYNSHPAGLFTTISGAPRLTLITCAGDYDFKHATYLQRLIVSSTFTARTA